MATKVMIIRHAEKPNDDASIHGVDESGNHDPDELSVQGWLRAGALIRLFAPHNGVFANPALATPDVIFACAPGKNATSVRSQHTVTPLAQLLKKPIDLRFQKSDMDLLVRSVAAIAGVVLIAWEHNVIPDIAAGIVGDGHTCPKKWQDARFDLVWVLDRGDGAEWRLTQVPQLVLPGDREDIIPAVRTGRA